MAGSMGACVLILPWIHASPCSSIDLITGTSNLGVALPDMVAAVNAVVGGPDLFFVAWCRRSVTDVISIVPATV